MTVSTVEVYELPNGAEVKFYPEEHKYVFEGKVLPSITTVIKEVCGDSYSFVDPGLLKRSADYGTSIHKEIQELIELRDEFSIPIDTDLTKHQEVENYFTLVEPIYKIEPLFMEKVVLLYNQENVPVAAGRFDMFALVAGTPTLIDIKTTSIIHRQAVTAQLNLYLKAARQSGYLVGYDEVNLGVVHLSGNTSKFVPIPVMKETFYQRFIPGEPQENS